MPSLSSRTKIRIFWAFLALSLFARLTLPLFRGDVQNVVAKNTFALDATVATQDLEAIAKYPHPFGSENQKNVAQYLMGRIRAEGYTPKLQSFKAEVPAIQEGPMSPLTKLVHGNNILAYPTQLESKPCLVLIGSHYDTKIVANVDYVGANDSGSSSVLLLQLLRFFRTQNKKNHCGLAAIWFDGEESFLEGWIDGETTHPAKLKDNTYGSRHFVRELEDCEWQGSKAKCVSESNQKTPIVGMVLFDLVGSPNIMFSLDLESTSSLTKELQDAAKVYGLEDSLTPHWNRIEDDHVPFVLAGIPAINIIDFSHLETWHQSGDVVASISTKSIENAGILGSYIVSRLLQSPQDFLNSTEKH